MSAGRGIVHSERTPKELIGRAHRSHGLQFWVALPEAVEASAPSFQHVPAERIPRLRIDGATIDVVVGSAFGATSPVETASPTLAAVIALGAFGAPGLVLPAGDANERALYPLDHPIEVDGEPYDECTLVVLAPGASPTLAAVIALGAFGAPELVLPAGDASERALYPLDHPIEVDGERYDECTLVVLAPGTSARLAAPRGGRVVLVGGEPLGHRFLSWNFVATSREKIRAAEDDWRAQRFPAIPGETEFIPLPERPPLPADDRTVPGAA